MLHRYFVYVLIFLATGIQISGQGDFPSDSIRISILTCAPGDQLYSMYGHNAIRVRDNAIGTDLVFNYGTFDFNTPGFAIKFMRGKLPYLLSVARYEDFIYEYTYFQRDVMEQELALSQEQKSGIISFLDENMRPENRAYAYDFFQDNCATRLRDIIEKHTDGLVWPSASDSLKTFRQIIKEYQQDRPWTNFGIDLILGAPADEVASLREQAFIPDYLADMMEGAIIQVSEERPLVLKTNEVLSFEKKQDSNFASGSPFFVFLIILIGELRFYFGSANNLQRKLLMYLDHAFLILITCASLLMIFMWFGTDHSPTKYNWNILWANPLWPVWWYASVYKKSYTKFCFNILQLALIMSFLNAVPGLQFLPQYFHPAILPVIGILWFKMRRMYN
jgi:hypothetical protein